MAETMAMALAEVGRFDEAVKWQQDAIAAASQGDRGLASRLTVNLRRYRARQPCRVPWTEDDPVPSATQQGVARIVEDDS